MVHNNRPWLTIDTNHGQPYLIFIMTILVHNNRPWLTTDSEWPRSTMSNIHKDDVSSSWHITQSCPKPCGLLELTALETIKSTGIGILLLKSSADPRCDPLGSPSWRGLSPQAGSNVMIWWLTIIGHGQTCSIHSCTTHAQPCFNYHGTGLLTIQCNAGQPLKIWMTLDFSHWSKYSDNGQLFSTIISLVQNQIW